MTKRKAYDPAVANRIKVGSPRNSKTKKGNVAARTSKCGNGKRLR